MNQPKYYFLYYQNGNYPIKIIEEKDLYDLPDGAIAWGMNKEQELTLVNMVKKNLKSMSLINKLKFIFGWNK